MAWRVRAQEQRELECGLGTSWSVVEKLIPGRGLLPWRGPEAAGGQSECLAYARSSTTFTEARNMANVTEPHPKAGKGTVRGAWVSGHLTPSEATCPSGTAPTACGQPVWEASLGTG